MPTEIPYEKQTLANRNPIARFAHKSRYRTSLRLAVELLPQGGVVLDFGAGPGVFLCQLKEARPDIVPQAYEPYMQLQCSGVEEFVSLNKIGEKSVDLLCCFETLEHLADADIDGFIDLAMRVCSENGNVLISIPIMQGCALPFKEISRYFMFGGWSYSFLELLRAVGGMDVERPGNLNWSHKGFSHRKLHQELSKHLMPVSMCVSPFNFLPWWLNSQFFSVYAPRRPR